MIVCVLINYALNVDSVLLGIVEAKKLTLGPQNVLGYR